MCEFISWVDNNGEILFFTAKDVKSALDKGMLEKYRHGFIQHTGHLAIREYYDVKIGAGKDLENKDFWNGQIPHKIKDAWNTGQLDGLLEYVHPADVEHITRNAPIEYITYIIAKTNKYWLPTIANATIDRNIEEIKRNSFYWLLIGNYTNNREFNGIKRNNDWILQVADYAATKNFDTTKIERPIIN